MKDEKAAASSRAIYESALEAVSDGIRTADPRAADDGVHYEVVRRV
jgi:hypothetical protein